MPHETEIHHRALDLQLRESDADRGIVEGLVVPYGIEAPIMESRQAGSVSYREVFRAGAFARAARAPSRVTLVYGHSDSRPDRLGFGLEFADTAEGLVGRFRLDPSTADHARDILLSGSHSGLSVGFVSIVPRAHTERDGALVVRESVHLIHVAAVPEGAYAAAGVTVVRAAGLITGEPTAAEVEAEARALEDRALLDFFTHARDRWASIATQ